MARIGLAIIALDYRNQAVHSHDAAAQARRWIDCPATGSVWVFGSGVAVMFVCRLPR